ncbi:four-carbon acid sugar kinase family protein [Variovorax robiniae]|uniref:Four-carbon acid sugar kinase family protein n=1 Tax=Variovorax robiniae TaxID=1836199 RepID=A0ABU8XC54_9BURK
MEGVASPQVVFYGDDFTGATDALGTAARAGMRSLLFLGVPEDGQLRRAGVLDCIGIAGAARSMAPHEMRAELAPVAALFTRLGAKVLHYKCCSTFDSAPEVGNIAVAVDVLRTGVKQSWVAVVGGQPELRRYCIFGNLFAAAGQGGEVHRIDRHPTMSRHPVTPMHEADLRRHLALQGLTGLGSLPYPTYAPPESAVSEALEALVASAPAGVLFDVAQQADLPRIGQALNASAHANGSLLAVGPSSVLQALAPARQPPAPAPAPVAPAKGPAFVLAGSLSPVTARQVAAARSFETAWLDPAALADAQPHHLDAIARQICEKLAAGRNVLACTAEGAPSSIVSSRALAEAGGALLARVLAATTLHRVGIAGGDTSSHAVKALDAWGLSYLAALSPGASLCRLHSDDPALDGCEIMLKGGQMGGEDVFERLVHGTP